ncbi:MAG: hypothetical protein HY667_03850 [Chloroflexi bacterium]|nr:hypothetical protein [Chloroflexota bacterium]
MKPVYRLWWSLLFATVWTISLAMAVPAQPERIDLSMTLSPNNYYNKIRVGEDNKLFLEIRNIGTKNVTNIRMTAVRPDGWTIEFKPAVIDSLGAGSAQTLDVNVRPNSRATKGNYGITLVAEANEIKKARDVRLTIETGSLFWLWIGAGVLLVLVLVFVFIFVRTSRQSI